MKIAVTCENRDTVTDHAGRCEHFWVYHTEFADVVDKHLVELPAGQNFRDLDLPPLLGDINVLITGGIARELRYRLKQMAIQAVATPETDPDRAVNAWLNGTLNEIPPRLQGACGGH
jgi:predicted Fe-Mo cluster-binding NifX family protein